MSMPQDEDPDKPARSDYSVGYRNPPVHTRYKKGHPGNPTGRRRRRKTVGQTIHEAMMAPVRIKVNGKTKTLTAQEVIIRNLVHAAAKGDTKAVHTLFGLKTRYQESAETTLTPSELGPNDRKIIEEYLAKVSGGGPAAKEHPANDATKNTERSAAPPERTPDEDKD
jgi:hypothetical protein